MNTFIKANLSIHLKVITAFIIWFLLYYHLQNISHWLTYQIFGLSNNTHLSDAIAFFIFETPKVLLLLTLIVFVMGVIRSFFSPESTRALLAGQSSFMSHGLASLLGVVTPFCSCSAVPLFIGFLTAGVPLGITFSFLIAAPMVNEIALGLLFSLFGWKIALLYLTTGLSIAMLAGYILGQMKLEKHVEEWVYQIKTNTEMQIDTTITWQERIEQGIQAVKEILHKVWFYILLGIAIGAGIHGYVPQDFMASILGNTWWSVPLAVIIGIPMYSNAAGIIPIVQALLIKGAALGTVLAFMMAVIALSLPELIILRRVLKPTLIASFVAIIAIGILLVGYLFNWIL